MKKLKLDFSKWHLLLNTLKKKEKRLKPAKPKIVTKKQADTVTLGLICLIVAIFLSGVVRMFTMVSTVADLQADMMTFRSDVRSATGQAEWLDVVLAAHVLDEFVPLWMNVDGSREVREEALRPFVSFDLATVADDTNRILHEFELLSMREMGRFNLATYRVSYQIKTEEATEMNVALHVPFVIRNGKVSVISHPYFTQIMPTLGEAEAFQMNIENDVSEEMAERRASIEKFLPIFFEMYAESDERSLALFMADPVLMGGHFELETVHLPEARLSFVGRDVMVQVMVTFRDGGTDFVHQAPFTLLLESQANSWFVREMHHLFIH